MKRVLFGAVLGAMAATAVYSCGNGRCVKRTKRMLVNKLEDLIS